MRSKHIYQRITRINTTKYKKYLAGGFKPVLFPSLFGKLLYPSDHQALPEEATYFMAMDSATALFIVVS